MPSIDYVEKINDHREPINRSLKSKLNKFFKQFPHLVEGCILRKNFDRASYALILEGSDLYNELNDGIGEYAYAMFEQNGTKPNTWAVHTAFHNAFNGSGYFPEMINSCVVGFYKD